MSVTVNGLQYATWQDVPDYLRRILEQQFPDADGNGVPDIFDSRAGLGPVARATD